MCVIYTSINNISKSPTVSNIVRFPCTFCIHDNKNAVPGRSFLNETLFAKQRVLFVFKAFVNKGFKNVFLKKKKKRKKKENVCMQYRHWGWRVGKCQEHWC